MNKMYTRQGYLYAQSGRNGSMKALGGGGWTKYYCQYVAKSKTLTMIPYNQTAGKITSTETIRVGECAFKEKEDSGGNKSTAATTNTGGADKFKFVVIGEDMGEGVAGVSIFTLPKKALVKWMSWSNNTFTRRNFLCQKPREQMLPSLFCAQSDLPYMAGARFPTQAQPKYEW